MTQVTSYQSRNVVLGRAFAATILDALAAAPLAELIDTGKIRLSKDSSFNPTPDSTRAALATNEADFSGYTAGGYACVLSANVRLGVNIVGKTAPALPICATATPLVVCNVYGYWVDDGTNVIVAEKFPEGMVAGFNAVGDYLDLLVAFPVMLLQVAL